MSITGTPISTVSGTSYLTVAEAAAMAHSKSAAWDAASDADQEDALIQATQHIDSLPLKGRRYELPYLENGAQRDANKDGFAQVLEFPRFIDEVLCDWDHKAVSPSGHIGMAVVPALVKRACLEEAIWILEHGDSQRLDNQQTGVASQTISGSSESYVAGFGLQTLQSPRARAIMRRYTGAEVR